MQLLIKRRMNDRCLRGFISECLLESARQIKPVQADNQVCLRQRLQGLWFKEKPRRPQVLRMICRKCGSQLQVSNHPCWQGLYQSDAPGPINFIAGDAAHKHHDIFRSGQKLGCLPKGL